MCEDRYKRIGVQGLDIEATVDKDEVTAEPSRGGRQERAAALAPVVAAPGPRVKPTAIISTRESYKVSPQELL